METVYLYDGNSKLLQQAKCDTLQFSNDKANEIIRASGGSDIIIIPDTSISSCTAEKDGRLVIETNAGRKIVFCILPRKEHSNCLHD